jgi:transposase-like protein
MKRPKGYCPSCEAEVEFYSDGVGAPGHPWRCGNCFQGFSDDQLTRMEKVKAELDAHEADRQQILNDALRP